MAENSKIEWTHHTFNHVRGCTKVSPGCANCYADSMSGRNPKVLGVWGKNGTRVIASESMWKEPIKWNRWAADGVCHICKGKGRIAGSQFVQIADLRKQTIMPCPAECVRGEVEPYRARVFCASLADVFEGRDTMPEASWNDVEQARIRLFELIEETPNLDWLLLTKRPENIFPFLNDAADESVGIGPYRLPDNVWLGTTVENQEQADKRIPELLKINAKVRFLSVEPMLGPIDVEPFLQYPPMTDNYKMTLGVDEWRGIDWIIVGGESGPNARPMHIDWVRSIRDQCQAAGVPFFMKQGSSANWSNFKNYDGFPADIQIREFPV